MKQEKFRKSSINQTEDGLKVQTIRFLVQLLFVIFIMALSIQIAYLPESTAKAAVSASHFASPFSSLETMLRFVGYELAYTPKYYPDLILFSGTILITFFFGRYLCGWICIFGSLQDWLGKIGSLLLRKRLKIPIVIERPMRYLKYIVLVLSLSMAWTMGSAVLARYNPYMGSIALFSDFSSAWSQFKIGLTIAGVALILSIMFGRVLCKYLCPVGALLGIINRGNLFRLERDNTRCLHCKECDASCPMEISIERKKKIKSAECISCAVCVTSCPTLQEPMQIRILGILSPPLFFAWSGGILFITLIAAAFIFYFLS